MSPGVCCKLPLSVSYAAINTITAGDWPRKFLPSDLLRACRPQPVAMRDSPRALPECHRNGIFKPNFLADSRRDGGRCGFCRRSVQSNPTPWLGAAPHGYLPLAGVAKISYAITIKSRGRSLLRLPRYACNGGIRYGFMQAVCHTLTNGGPFQACLRFSTPPLI